MKLLIDMNLSPRWVQTLIAAGFEANHCSTIGRHTAPDVEIMDYARLHGYIVLTNDLDFSEILAATSGEKPSVIQIRAADLTPGIIAPQVVAALHQMATQLDEGALLTIDTKRTRLRPPSTYGESHSRPNPLTPQL
jgi:predicted nuclease of predicted toxin-antitoxin system